MTVSNKDYCFVIDAHGKRLAPTTIGKGWYLIRKGRARLIEYSPVSIMAIQLNRVIDNPVCDITLGVDDGSKHVGVALVQKCSTKNKCVFKGTIEHRGDVSKLMGQRASYRGLRRNEKKYRPKRFNNRSSSRRKGRVAPSVFQKRQAVIRFISKIIKWVDISQIVLEDVAFDVRALTDGYKPYPWQYQRSNRLDENIRKAVLMRDGYKCMMCGESNCMLEAHHINPQRLFRCDALSNLITLCSVCHRGISGKEEDYIVPFQNLIGGKTLRLDYAQHVMQGKYWLRAQLSKIAALSLTDGGTTANHRIDWGFEKSHHNDAIAITGLKPDKISSKVWHVNPKRKKRKMKDPSEVCGFRHGDYASYVDTKGIKWIGYITAMYQDKLQVNIQCKTKHLKRVNAKKCLAIYRYSNISIT